MNFASDEMQALQSVLTEAAALVSGQRQKDYGPPAENMAHVVAIFAAWTGVNLTPRQGAQFLMALKMARLQNSPHHRDSHVDLAGYTDILWQCAEHERTTTQAGG